MIVSKFLHVNVPTDLQQFFCARYNIMRNFSQQHGVFNNQKIFDFCSSISVISIIMIINDIIEEYKNPRTKRGISFLRSYESRRGEKKIANKKRSRARERTEAEALFCSSYRSIRYISIRRIKLFYYSRRRHRRHHRIRAKIELRKEPNDLPLNLRLSALFASFFFLFYFSRRVLLSVFVFFR